MKKRLLAAVVGLMLGHAVVAAESPSVGIQLNARVCGLIKPLGLLESRMPVETLYRLADGQCQAVTPDQAGDYHGGADCSGEPIRYRALSVDRFCSEVADPARFGNGDNTETGIWFQHPGMRLKIALESQKGHYLPFETRAVYKTVTTPRGQCKLEMRIYTRRPGVHGLRPLLMFHGGSWQTRQAGMLGLQAEVARYTDEGFVVFMPFYRLTGEAEANAACNGATGEQIVEDAESALSWVMAHAGDYGAAPSARGVLVAGQSAGGQLAARLAVDHPRSVAAALLMYAPVDFSALVTGLRNGGAAGRPGKAALSAFIGQDAATAPVDLPIVRDNSLPERILAMPDPPPLFLIHGDADRLVPVDQSVRLCNALAGDVENGPASDIGVAAGQARREIVCNDASDSRLVVIHGADHALDYCLGAVVDCPARDAIHETLKQARGWLKAVGGDYSGSSATSSTSGERQTPPADNSSGGGALLWLLPMLGIVRAVRLSRRL